MYSSGNRTRSVLSCGKYRSIRHTKISEIQTGIFGRIERAFSFQLFLTRHISWCCSRGIINCPIIGEHVINFLTSYVTIAILWAATTFNFSFKGTLSRFWACARVWFLNRWLRIQRCGNWRRAFTNPFASASINFGFVLKLLRIKDQWYTVLVLTSMPFDGTSSGGKCYGAGRRRLSFGTFQKG